MKNKDFGFFQQHAEKIALGLGLAVLAGVGATQFLLGGPNQIEIDNRTIEPGEIKDTVVAEAQRLERSLNADSPIEPREIPNYTQSFVSLYERPVAAATPLAPIDQVGLADTWIKVVQPDYPDKVLPEVPVVTSVFVKNDHGVLDNVQDQQVFAIREMIGNPEPADFPYVSVTGKFSFAQWVERLRSPDIPSTNRVEEGLWADRLAITAVQLVREELLDPATDEWGNRTEINPLPGQYAVLPAPSETPREMEMDQAEQMEEWILQNQPLIRRPPFPPIVNGVWTPPSAVDRVLTPADLKRQREIREQIENLERRIERISQDSANPPRGNNRQPEQDQFFDEFGGDDRGGRGRPPRDRGPNLNEREPQLTSQERQLQRMYDELEAAQREMDELLGVEPDSQNTINAGDPFMDPMMEDPGNFGQPGGPRGRGRFTEDFGMPAGRGNNNPADTDVPEEVSVWAHDLTIEPGKTYRYKMKVYVLNPLFRNPRLNDQQIKQNRFRVALAPSDDELATADWSAPIKVDRESYFFVTSGNRDRKSADFEVWTIHNGVWRTSTFTEYPGNEIGEVTEIPGASGRVPMNVGSIMLDVDTVSNPSGGGSLVRVLYLDDETNQIGTRLVREDEQSIERTRLQLERDRQLEQQNVQLGDARF